MAQLRCCKCLQLLTQSIDILSGCLVAFAVKTGKQRFCLSWRSVINQYIEVDATGSDERWVEFLQVIRRHKYDSFLSRRDSIECIQKARECDRGLVPTEGSTCVTWDSEKDLPVVARSYTLIESSIHIFDEDETTFRSIREKVNQFIIGEATLREVQKANIIRE